MEKTSEEKRPHIEMGKCKEEEEEEEEEKNKENTYNIHIGSGYKNMQETIDLIL